MKSSQEQASKQQHRPQGRQQSSQPHRHHQQGQQYPSEPPLPRFGTISPLAHRLPEPVVEVLFGGWQGLQPPPHLPGHPMV